METSKLDKLINNSTRSNTFKSFDTAYLLTTENINGYMHGMSGQDVLTVCSSGDHFLSALFDGAFSIDLFDINEFTLYALNLKIAAIRCLNYEEYLTYIGIINRLGTLDYNLYLKLRSELTDLYRESFDYLYEQSENNGLKMLNESSVFYNDRTDGEIMLSNCDYYEESNFYALKKLLNSRDFDINFTRTNLFDLPYKLDKKYDSIFLSNINDYQKAEKILEITNILKDYLNDYGMIYFAYLYNNPCGNTFYKAYNDYVASHPECYSLKVPSVYRSRDTKRQHDNVLMLRKY